MLKLGFLPLTSIVMWPSFRRTFASALAFRPTPPPRFDAFSERLVGSWNSAAAAAARSEEGQIVVVEEVMRSCGGAVQGLREPAERGDGSVYLNRANDGFVFFDDGCYTFGPVRCDESDFYLQSLMVGNGESRVVIRVDSGEPSAFLRWKKSGALFDDARLPTVVASDSSPCSLRVDFAETITCAKSSPAQPWMLQRAKWRKDAAAGSRPGDSRPPPAEEEEEPASLDDSEIRCWSLTHPAAEFYEWIAPSSDRSEKNELGTVVQAGTLCEASGAVNAIARHYDPSHELERILLVRGALKSEGE